MNGRDFQLELQSTIAAWRRTASHPCHCSDTEPTYSKERNTGQKLLILQVFMPDMASNIAFRYLGQRYQNQSMQEAIAALERRWAFPPHAGCPYQPVWILNHFRKWVQEYLHAKVKVQIANSLSSHHVSWGLHRESHWCPPDLTNTKYLKTANARLGAISENVGHSSAMLQSLVQKKSCFFFETVLKRMCSDKFPANENWNFVLFILLANPQTI